MVGSIFDKGVQPPGTTARLKVSSPSVTNFYTGMTSSEKQLADIVDIGSAAQERAQKVRKLDAYLRIFSTAIDYLNGRFKRYTPQFSKVDVEFIPPAKKDSLKIDV